MCFQIKNMCSQNVTLRQTILVCLKVTFHFPVPHVFSRCAIFHRMGSHVGE